MNYSQLTLPQIYQATDDVVREVKITFGPLDAQQLNWKGSADSWSVAQCLEHVMAINRAFHPAFDAILNGEHRRGLIERLPVLPTLFGRIMIAALSPEGRRKYKAPSVAVPSSSAIRPDIVDRFIDQQRETLAKMKALGPVDPAGVVIRSPFAPMPYSLLDGFRIIVAHEHRHLAQARRVMTSDGFPSIDVP